MSRLRNISHITWRLLTKTKKFSQRSPFMVLVSRDIVHHSPLVWYRLRFLGVCRLATEYSGVDKFPVYLWSAMQDQNHRQKINFPWQRSIMFSNAQLCKDYLPPTLGRTIQVNGAFYSNKSRVINIICALVTYHIYYYKYLSNISYILL